MIVADASALVTAVAVGSPVSDRLLARLIEEEVHCPSHVDAEVGQALRRATLSHPAHADRAFRALGHASQMVSFRHEAPGHLTSLAWSLRDRVSFYDALYVALATLLDAPLVTADARLAKANLPCQIDLVE